MIAGIERGDGNWLVDFGRPWCYGIVFSRWVVVNVEVRSW